MTGRNRKSAGSYRNDDSYGDGSYKNENSHGDSGRWITNNGSSSYGFNSGPLSSELIPNGGYQGSPWMQNGTQGTFNYGDSECFTRSRDTYGIPERYGTGTSQSFANSSYGNDYNSGRNSYNFAERVHSTGEQGYNPVASNSLDPESYKDPDSILKELGKCYLSTLSNGGAPGPLPANAYGNYSYGYTGGYNKSKSSPWLRGYETGQGRAKLGQVKARSNSGQVKRSRETSQSGANAAGNKNWKKPRLNVGRQLDYPQGRQYSGKPQARQSSAKLQARQTSGKPQARQSSAKLQARQTSGKPQARQLSAKPQAGQSSAKPQAGQSSAKPQVNSNQTSNLIQVEIEGNKGPVNNAPKAKSGEMSKRAKKRSNAAQQKGDNAQEVQKPNAPNNTSKPEATIGKKALLSQKRANGNKNRLTKRYSKIDDNKFLDESGRVLVAFLRQALEGVYPEDRMHALLVSYYLLKHRNAVQLYQYELRMALDKKFGVEANEETKKAKLDYLSGEKSQVLEELQIVYEEKNKEEVSRKLIDECIELLTKDVYPEECVPQNEDYIEHPEETKTEEDLTHEFQCKFLSFVYVQFGYSLPENQGTLEQTLKFHLNNSVIAALLVELVQSSTLRLGDKIGLPDALSKKLVRWNNSAFYRQKCENFNQAVIRRLAAQNEHLQTSVLDLLPPGTKWSTKFVRDMSEAVLMFDDIATVTKHKLLEYTPYINLTKQVKLGIFNELVNSVYTDVLDVLKNGVPLLDKTFVKAEGEPDGETQTSEGERRNGETGNEKMNEALDSRNGETDNEKTNEAMDTS